MAGTIKHLTILHSSYLLAEKNIVDNEICNIDNVIMEECDFILTKTFLFLFQAPKLT